VGRGNFNLKFFHKEDQANKTQVIFYQLKILTMIDMYMINRLRKSTLVLSAGAYMMYMIRYMNSNAHPMELTVISITALVFKKA
jgi:hypothetical protein